MPFHLYRPEPPIRWTWLRLIGPDAKDFLHRMSTVDVRNLNEGTGTKGFFLDPQGKIRAFFTLWHVQKDAYAFELDAGEDEKWKQNLLSTIDQFTFGEKFELSPPPVPLHSRWLLGDEAHDPGADLGIQPGETRHLDPVRVCHHGSRDYGRPKLSILGTAEILDAWLAQKFPSAQPASFETLEKWRIEAVSPRLDHELLESSNPLEVGLREAIADQKGCYPGQEVIEKIISLGSPARRLSRIRGQTAAGTIPQAGDTLYNVAEPPAEVGRLTSVTYSAGSGEFSALGLIRKIHAKEGLDVRIGSSQPTTRQLTKGSVVQVAPYDH